MKLFRILGPLLRRNPRGGQQARGSGFSLRENWWVLLFCAAAGVLYLQGMREKESVYADLQKRLCVVQSELHLASSEREELLRQIHSQSDPDWIEIVLMKRLGLVPEGQTKVYFEKAQP